MNPSLLLCLTIALCSAHDPAGGAKHGAHVDDAKWKKPAPSTTPVYVGEGAHRYLWESEWLQLPEGRKWLGSTHGCIVVDSRDRVYLSAESGAAVLVFSPEGQLLDSFGEEWGAGLHGLTIVDEAYEETMPSGEVRRGHREVLYLAHTAAQVVLKTTLAGEVLQRVEAPPASSGLYENPASYKPTSVALAPDGTLFIADGYGLSWIHRYSQAGEYLGSFGGRGEGPQHLHTPHGLWMDTLSEPATLLVADRENHRLARFALDGTYIGGTDPSSGFLRRPCHVQFLGELGVVSDLAGRTTLIDSKLELVAQLGDNPDASQRARFDIAPNLWREGVFCAPHCARFNSKGDLFVMDWNVAGRVTRLKRAPE